MKWVQKRNILSAIFAVAAAFWLSSSSAAAGISYSISSNYEVNKEGASTVTHVIDVANSGNDRAPAEFELPVIGTEVTSVSAALQDNTILKTKLDKERQVVTVSLGSQQDRSAAKWSFKLSYKTTLLRTFGETKALQIPSLGELNGLAVNDHRISVAAALDLGFATTRGPEPNKTNIAVGRQIISYRNKNGLFNDSIMLLFGDSAVARVDISATLKNSGYWWDTVEYTMPPDTNQQQVLISSIEPQPTSVRLDVDGNVVVAYRLGPRQEKTITAKALVRTNSVSYDLSSSLSLNEIDSALVEQYTRATDNWHAQGFDISADGSSAEKLIAEVHAAVVEQVSDDILSNPLSVSARGQGLKYADMLVGELRSRGVPARVVLGKVFSDGKQLLSEPINHAWAEAYAPGIGWMTLDPVFSASGDYYGATDITHIGMVLWGISDDRPPINLDVVRVQYTDSEFAVAEVPPVITAKKYIILPGISVLSVSAITSPGAIIDDTGLKTVSNNALIPLGSLAPLQTAVTRTLRMGGGAFSKETVEFGIISGDQLLSGASRESSLSFRVVFYELAALFVSVFVVGYIRYRRFRKARMTPADATIAASGEFPGGNIEDENLITTPAPEQYRDTLPNVVDPGQSTAADEQPANDQPQHPSAQNSGTIKANGQNGDRHQRPPHSNLVQ